MIQPAPPRRSHLFLYALAWTVFAVYGSLVPLRYQATDLDYAIERFRNLPPFGVGMGTRADWVANILLFIPLTFFWMGALACDKNRAARIAAAILLVPLAAAASVALEFTQLWFPGRTVGLNDIVAETLGGVLGVLLWFGVGQTVVAWRREYSVERRPRSRLVWLLQAYLLGFIIWSVIPLDLTISLTELYHKYQRGQVLVIPFAYSYASPADVMYQFFADIMVFVPVGAWVALTQQHRLRALSPLLAAVVGGGLIAAAIEFAQLLVQSRFTDVTDVLLGTLGAAIGAWLVLRSDRTAFTRHDSWSPGARVRASMFWLAALAGYSLFLAAGFWFPFELTRDHALIVSRLDEFFRVPLYSLYLGNEFNALQQLLVRLLLFAPIGVLWAHIASLAGTTRVRRLLAFVGIVYSACLAFGIEAAQVLMPSKIADFTEVLICTAGALGGLYVTLGLLPSRSRDVPTEL